MQITAVSTNKLLAVRLPADGGNSSCCLLTVAVVVRQQLHLLTPHQASLACRSHIS